MAKKLLLLMAIATLVGCQRVALSTTAYVDHEVLPAGFAHTATFCVCPDDTSNTLLGKALQHKLEQALVRRGYRLADRDEAEYVMMFSYATESKDKLVGVEQRPKHWLELLARVCESFNDEGQPTPATQYVSETVTVYTSSLQLQVFAGRNVDTGALPVWEGWSATDNDRAFDMRRVDDYLVHSALQHFGISSGTHRRMVYTPHRVRR